VFLRGLQPRKHKPVSNADLQAAWEATLSPLLAERREWPTAETPVIAEQWLVLVTCRDEKQQVELLERFRREGLECKALLCRRWSEDLRPHLARNLHNQKRELECVKIPKDSERFP
jgi:hypothetical protein